MADSAILILIVFLVLGMMGVLGYMILGQDSEASTPEKELEDQIIKTETAKQAAAEKEAATTTGTTKPTSTTTTAAEKKAAAEAKKKEEQEAAEEAAETVYYFGKVCPVGFTDLGEAGILLLKGNKSGFKKGGNVSSGWDWHHPQLCEGKSTATKLTGLYKFATPTAAGGVGEFGILKRNGSEGTELRLGGRYSDDWKWYHGNLVPASKKGGYKLMNNGSKGSHAFLTSTVSANKSPFTLGSKYGSKKEWQWVHPDLGQA